MPDTKLFKNRKQKRQFDKLPEDKKQEVIAALGVQKISKTLTKQIAKAMIAGAEQDRVFLYNKYVSIVDDPETPEDKKKKTIDELLSFLRLAYLKDAQNKNKGESAEDEVQ